MEIDKTIIEKSCALAVEIGLSDYEAAILAVILSSSRCTSAAEIAKNGQDCVPR